MGIALLRFYTLLCGESLYSDPLILGKTRRRMEGEFQSGDGGTRRRDSTNVDFFSRDPPLKWGVGPF